MQIRASGGTVRADVSPDDVLWLLRAVEAEGEPRERVARTLVHLWAALRERGDKRSLGALVRAYAQPVNPRWMPGGDLHERAVARAKTEVERRALRSRALMRQTRHATRTEFTEKTRQAVARALSDGAHAEVATDYAAPWVDAAHKYAPVSEKKTGENRFWTRFPARALGYVVEAAGGEAKSDGVAWLAVIAVGVLLAIAKRA